MGTLRPRATGWLGRFGVPILLSLLLHAVVAVQRIRLEQPPTAVAAPLAVALRPERADPPARPTPRAEPPPPSRHPTAPPTARSRRGPPPRPAPTPPPSPRTRAPVHDHPPRPAGPASARRLSSASQGAAASVAPSHAGDVIAASAGEPSQISSSTPPEAPGGGATAGGGAGFTFDFWSPPDFNRELERAERTIGAAARERERIRSTDLGAGVICNTAGYWFVCGEADIQRCNAAHDGMCRYATPAERRVLTDEVILFQ